MWPSTVLDAVQAAVQAVLPARCPGCGRPALALCPDCLGRLRPAAPAAPPPGLDWWVAPFAYDGPFRELVARAKYRGARTGLPWLAGQVVAVLPAGLPGVVSWPPTTADRRRRRGFDPAERLARLVASRLGLPVAPLLRRRPGPPQTGRSRAERARGPLFDPRPSAVSPAVLLIDDVATTGATLAAAAAVLRAAGATAVAAATAARTPGQVSRAPSRRIAAEPTPGVCRKPAPGGAPGSQEPRAWRAGNQWWIA